MAAAIEIPFAVLNLDAPHGVVPVVVLAIGNALLGTVLGLFLSAFARTEFLPAFLLPQLLLCGLVVPRDEMGVALEWIARFLPMSYAYDALERTARPGPLGGAVLVDAVMLAGVGVAALGLGALTLRRRTP